MKLRKNFSVILIIMFIISSFNITKASSIDFDGQALQQQEFNNIVIFADFADSTENFMTSEKRSTIIDMYNGTSVKALSNYISSVSNGKMKVNNYFPQDNNGIITPYRLSQPRSYYNNSTEYEMIQEIISKVSVDSDIPLDGNNDGQVDNVSFVFLGGSTSTTDVFWPHKQNHQNGSAINGKTVNVYNVHNEESIFQDRFSGGKGVIAHEFLHSLGLPDLYRGSGSAVPVGRWDIMANVSSTFLQYPLTYLRKHWVNMETVSTSGTYTLNLATSKEGTQGVIIKTPLSEKEFFVVEYRKEGNSYTDELEAKIYGTGLIIYRVNTEVSTNFSGPKDYIYVFRPGETGEGNGAGDLYKSFLSEESGRTTYGTSDMNADITHGAITYSSGLNSGIVIKNVSSAAGDTMTFQVEVPDLSDAGVWNLLGDGPVNTIESNQASMDVFENEVYVTYSEGYGTKQLKAAKFDGSKWSLLGTGLSSEGYDGKIKVYNGVPYIIYHKYDENFNYKLYAANLENGVWNEFQTISTGEAQYSQIISTNSGLYVAYTDSGTDVLKVAKLNSSINKFEQVGSDIASGYIYGISLAEDNGVLYVSYSNFNEWDKIHVKSYSEGTWSEAGTLDVTGKATNIVAKAGKVYLAVGGNELKVYELIQGAFTKVGENIAGSEGLYPKVQVLDNKPYICYFDYNMGEIKFKLFNGTQWAEDGYRVSDKRANNINFIIENGTGYISYLDDSGMVEVRTRKLIDQVTEPEPEPDPVYEAEDVDKNGVIDINDIATISLKYNVTSKDENWDGNLDLNEDGIIDLYDIVRVSAKIN